MQQSRRMVSIAMISVTLGFAVFAGGAIAWLAYRGSPPVSGNWRPPAEPSATSTPTSSPSAAPSPEPPTQAPPTASPTPPAPTVAEPTVTPTLVPVEVQTPPSTAVAGASSLFVEYVVQPGDILKEVAQSFDVSVAAIVELNPEIDPDNLAVGDVLLVPQK